MTDISDIDAAIHQTIEETGQSYEDLARDVLNSYTSIAATAKPVDVDLLRRTHARLKQLMVKEQQSIKQPEPKPESKNEREQQRLF